MYSEKKTGDQTWELRSPKPPKESLVPPFLAKGACLFSANIFSAIVAPKSPRHARETLQAMWRSEMPHSKKGFTNNGGFNMV